MNNTKINEEEKDLTPVLQEMMERMHNYILSLTFMPIILTENARQFLALR
jgi:hypothetical protein